MNVNRIDLAAVLAQTPLLATLSQPELQNLAARTVRKLFSSGELIFSEGEPCNGLHIIARGNFLMQVLNGHVMSQLIDDDTANRKMDGLLGIQVHRGPAMKIEVKSIRLKTLP